MTTSPSASKTAFVLKGSVLTLSVLQIMHHDVSSIDQQLQETVEKNPNFFKNMPIVIDLQKMYGINLDIDFVSLVKQLRHHGLVPVGVSNGNANQINAALEAGLGVLPAVKAKEAPKSSSKKSSAKIVNQPIRSGQQIYAKNTDLIVLASVSNGAEVLADGNIHIYGALRGRAIAGVSGNQEARIFCQKLEAELICIAGYYKLHEDIQPPEAPHGTYIFLENEQLSIVPIGH